MKFAKASLPLSVWLVPDGTFFVTGNHERVVCHPTFVADIEDLKNNVGFSKQDVKLSFDAELVFKAEM